MKRNYIKQVFVLWVPMFSELAVFLKRRIRPERVSMPSSGGLFFNDRPCMTDPVADGFFVPLHSLSGGSLQTPSKSLQQFPDVAGMIFDSGNSLNHDSNSGKSPQVGRKSMLFWSFSQCLVDFLQYLRIVFRFSSGSARTLQRFLASYFPCVIPTACSLSAYTKGKGNLGLFLALFEKLRTLKTSLTQFLMITRLTRLCFVFHSSFITQSRKDVTILCEGQ